MSPKINRRLSLVLPVESDGLGTVQVHSMPISREVFERYYKILGCSLTTIFQSGLGPIAGARTAALVMRDESERLLGPRATPEDKAEAWAEVQSGLFGEIHRLTNVIVPGKDTIPYDEAVKRTIISEDDAREVENALAFFTVISSTMRGEDLEAALEGLRIWGGSSTLLNSTAFASSLTTSTGDGNSGKKNPTSSPPP